MRGCASELRSLDNTVGENPCHPREMYRRAEQRAFALRAAWWLWCDAGRQPAVVPSTVSAGVYPANSERCSASKISSWLAM